MGSSFYFPILSPHSSTQFIHPFIHPYSPSLSLTLPHSPSLSLTLPHSSPLALIFHRHSSPFTALIHSLHSLHSPRPMRYIVCVSCVYCVYCRYSRATVVTHSASFNDCVVHRGDSGCYIEAGTNQSRVFGAYGPLGTVPGQRVVVLEEGHALLIPWGWYHDVDHLTPTVSLVARAYRRTAVPPYRRGGWEGGGGGEGSEWTRGTTAKGDG